MLQHSQFKDVVKSIWSQPVDERDSAKIIAAKFKRLRKGLKIWSRQLSDLKKIIADTNFMILCYDYFEDFRSLSIEESNGRDVLKNHIAMLLEHQRIYWKQRATIRMV